MLVSSILALSLTSPARAQDQEYHQPDVAPSTGKAAAKFLFETEFHSYDNLDFRPLDESSDQSILDSDDKNQFGFSGIGADIGYAPTDDMSIQIAASHRGLWGNDQIETSTALADSHTSPRCRSTGRRRWRTADRPTTRFACGSDASGTASAGSPVATTCSPT